MKKLLKKLRKMRSSVTIGVNKRPFIATLGMLLAANLGILLVAGIIAGLLPGPEGRTFVSGFVDAVLWLVVPPHALRYFGADDGTFIGLTILGIMVTVTGIVLFMGTVVALVTNGLRTYINSKADAQGKLELGEHYVVLNYNDKLPALLVDSMYKDLDDTYMVLSDRPKEYVKGVIKAELAIQKKKPPGKLKLIIRKGNPYYATDLTDVCVQHAKGILIFHDDKEAEREDGVDLDVIRLLMTVAECEIRDDCRVVVETRTGKTRQIVDNLCKKMPLLQGKNIVAYSYNRKLGQFLANSVLCPDITPVMYDLLSFDGSTFFETEYTPCADFLAKYSDSLPVTIHGKTFAMAENAKKIEYKRDELFSTDKKLAPSTIKRPEVGTLYIIGQNKKLDYMTASLVQSRYKPHLKMYKTADRKDYVKDILADTGTRTAVILSDDTGECNDDNVFLTLINLVEQCGFAPDFKIIAEIFDPKKQRTVEQFGVHNVIISNRIVSFFALQMLVSKSTGDFFEELFSPVAHDGNFDLWVDEAKYLFDFADNDKYVFDNYAEFVLAAYNGADGKIMPLGFRRGGENIYFSCEGLDKVRDVVVTPEDKVIYVLYR